MVKPGNISETVEQITWLLQTTYWK